MHTKSSLAFSLIELMVVIAIVAVLSAVALPSYKNYKIKAEASKMYSILESLKPIAMDSYNKTGAIVDTATVTMPDGSIAIVRNAANFPANYCLANYTNSIGYVAVSTVNPDLWINTTNSRGFLGLVASDNNGVVSWSCVTHLIEPVRLEYFPSNCVQCS